MGTRYWLNVKCDKCGVILKDVYYAPTCDFVNVECNCGNIIDLGKYTGITYEDASNIEEIRNLYGDIPAATRCP